MKNVSKKITQKINSISFGHYTIDKQLKMGLMAIILLLILGLLIRNIISEMIEKLFIFGILFIVTFLITHNWAVSLIVSAILYWLVMNLRNAMSREKFENQTDSDTPTDDKKFLKKLSKKENTDENTVEAPVTSTETADMDLNHAAAEMAKLADKLQGGIALKDDDKKETAPLNIDFRNTKYSEDKMSAQKRAQIETYELMDSIKNLESTIKSLNPVLSEGKKIMDMFEQFNIEKK